MENTHEYTHPIDTQEQETKDNEFEQDEFYQRKNYYLITEEEPKNIHPELYQKFSSPKMNSGIMSIHHNDPEKSLMIQRIFANTVAEP